MQVQGWIDNWYEVNFYLFQKMCEFLRWINFPIEYWIWLDKIFYDGAL